MANPRTIHKALRARKHTSQFLRAGALHPAIQPVLAIQIWCPYRGGLRAGGARSSQPAAFGGFSHHHHLPLSAEQAARRLACPLVPGGHEEPCEELHSSLDSGRCRERYASSALARLVRMRWEIGHTDRANSKATLSIAFALALSLSPQPSPPSRRLSSTTDETVS